MPIFEYRCVDCKKSFEVLLRSKQEQIECPDCKGQNLEKQISSFAQPSSAGSKLGCGESTCPASSCCGGNCML